jgi:hypothetical protein
MASAGMMGHGGRRIAELPLFAQARPEAVACCRRRPWLALHCHPPRHDPASPRKGHYPFDVTTTALNHQAGGAHEKEGQWEGMTGLKNRRESYRADSREAQPSASRCFALSRSPGFHSSCTSPVCAHAHHTHTRANTQRRAHRSKPSGLLRLVRMAVSAPLLRERTRTAHGF